MLKDNMFHPFEFAICGYSGSGKTTLIEKLLKNLSTSYKIGYIKHDAHKFDMDKEGKDTWKALNSGAHEIYIHNENKWARIGNGESNKHDFKFSILNLDFALVEGHKNTNIAKLIVLGEGATKQDILAAYKNNKLENVLGFIGVDMHPDFETSLPYFQRNDYSKISDFILNHLNSLIAKIPVNGLVLAGGLSKRMGTDKGALNYHGKSQTEYMYELLNNQCKKTYVSCREEQAKLPHLKNLNHLFDSFKDMGPLSGILSAFQRHPDTAWMVVACDLPYVDNNQLKHLLKNRDPFKVATCYQNPEKGWAEPLCSIYEPKAFARLLQFYAQGYKCPRKMLMNSSLCELSLQNSKGMQNANTPEDYMNFTGINL